MGFLVWMSFAMMAVIGWQWAWQELSRKAYAPLASFWHWLKWAPQRVALAKLAFEGLENLVLLFVLDVLALQINGAFFVLVGAIVWLIVRAPWSGVFFGLGLFLMMIERAFQMSSVIFSSSIHLPWVFVLGDSTPATLIMIFLAAGVLGLLLPWLWLHLIVGFLWYAMGLSSIAVAAMIVTAGLIGFRLRRAFQERKSDLARPYLYRFILSCFILPVALVLAGLVERPQELSERAGVFLGVSALVVLVELALSAVFFHFYSAWVLRRIKAHG